MIIEIFRGTNSQYYFRIKARNGRIIAQSEGYKRKRAIEKLLFMKQTNTGWEFAMIFNTVKDLTSLERQAK